MIPKAYIAKWKDKAPWNSNDQIEQDLIISRTLVAIFSDEFLKENLAFRGGTALHKLYLNPAPRYSEDIDLVQIKAGPITPILNHIDKVITFFEEKRVVKQKANNNAVIYRFNSEYEETRLRLKLEINCREHFNVLDWVHFPFKVENGWFTGEAALTTYNENELLGTKLRALYQRKKGRDLFDLYYAYQNLEIDYGQLINCYNEYMAFVVDNPPSRRQFLQNVEEKQIDRDFTGDMEGLLRPEIEYDQTQAFKWLKQDIIEKLK